MPRWVDRAKENTTTTGTGTVSLTGAALGFRTFVASGLNTGDVVNYLIEDVSSAWELGWGIFTGGGSPTLTRNVRSSSSANALLNLSGSAVVEVTIAADDPNYLFAASIVF